MKTYLWEPGVRPDEEYSTPEEQVHVSTMQGNTNNVPEETDLPSICLGAKRMSHSSETPLK